jgi:phosphatidylethanolamine-binding protein (PEBP) family uncharacterized protein
MQMTLKRHFVLSSSDPALSAGVPEAYTAKQFGCTGGNASPSPAKGDPPHRYVFTVYALKVAKLPVPVDSSGAMVTSELQEHLLAKAVLVVRHGR